MSRTAAPTRRLRSIAQIAEYLGVHERTVRRYIGSGQLKAYRLGGGENPPIRLDLADVDAFVVAAEPHEVSA